MVDPQGLAGSKPREACPGVGVRVPLLILAEPDGRRRDVVDHLRVVDMKLVGSDPFHRVEIEGDRDVAPTKYGPILQ